MILNMDNYTTEELAQMLAEIDCELTRRDTTEYYEVLDDVFTKIDFLLEKNYGEKIAIDYDDCYLSWKELAHAMLASQRYTYGYKEKFPCIQRKED
ncbi:MAG: hypothetical protein IKI31_01660 [Treponema sp.]|nr:hypothetical protein [Treponema sp.]